MHPIFKRLLLERQLKGLREAIFFNNAEFATLYRDLPVIVDDDFAFEWYNVTDSDGGSACSLFRWQKSNAAEQSHQIAFHSSRARNGVKVKLPRQLSAAHWLLVLRPRL